MGTNKRETSVILADTIIEAAANYPMYTGQSFHNSVQVNAVVVSTAKTFVDQTLATLAIGTTVTYTATAAYGGTAGNAITIEFVAGGIAGAEVVTVVGTAISVLMDVTAVTGSTGTQIKAAIAAKAEAAALVTGSGTAAAVQAAQAATPLAGGVNASYSIANDTIAITAHGFYTGLKVRLTSTGTLPAGLATGTDYYVFVIDANTISLFDSLAHALAARMTNLALTVSAGLVGITGLGSNASTATATPVTISGVSYKLQKSNDYIPSQGIDGVPINAGNWIDYVAGETDSVITNTITVTGSSMVDTKISSATYIRVLFAISAGTVGIKVIGHL